MVVLRILERWAFSDRCILLFCTTDFRTHKNDGLITNALCLCECSHYPAPFLPPSFPLSFLWLLLSLFLSLPFPPIPSFSLFLLSSPFLPLPYSLYPLLLPFFLPLPSFINHSTTTLSMHQAVWNEGE